ncbi:MAG: PilZ domain-containing protein [Planctomycetia bacterium]|nr:PilZ domain-containing protein [Planctomycetia bacterium]
MPLGEMLETGRVWALENLPIAVGGFVAFLVLTFLTLNATLGRRRTREPLDPAKLAANAKAAPPLTEKALNWDPPEHTYADRRGAVRRDGQPVRVVLASVTFRNGVCDAYVIDRSTGGLRIAVQTAIEPGSTLQVRALDAPEGVEFVTIIVRSCRKNTDYFELGCEFEKTPPWNILLLFG